LPARRGTGAAEFDDAAYLQLSDLLYRLRQARTAVGVARRSARRAAPRLLRSVAAIRRLPVLEVEVSDSPAGEAIASALAQRRGLVPATTAAAVLELTAEPEAYLVGRRRQAVRTGLNHARRHGLSVRKVTEREERRARALELVDAEVHEHFGPSLRQWAAAPRDESWFTLDAHGRTLAVAILTVDGSVARLNAVISADGPLRSPARYLLSASVFMDLARSGVSHVLLEGSLFLPPGLLHFQRLLGFRPMNIRVRRAQRAQRLASRDLGARIPA
jgi:hypothetical protein